MPLLQHTATSIIGVDVGIVRFATLSNGQLFEAVNSFKQKQARLARYQRALARKVKFSSNWKMEITERQNHPAAQHHCEYQERLFAQND